MSDKTIMRLIDLNTSTLPFLCDIPLFIIHLLFLDGRPGKGSRDHNLDIRANGDYKDCSFDTTATSSSIVESLRSKSISLAVRFKYMRKEIFSSAEEVMDTIC